MAGNHAGAIKTRDKNLANDPDYYRKIGAAGGRACVKKGFGANPELAREAGRKGRLKKKENLGSKMKIDIEQVWEYEFKPTDTMRLLHAFKNHWENSGDEISLERRGDRIFAVRKENKQTDHDKRMLEHYRKLREYYDKNGRS